uniref:SEA domain-containing protein n=1 Tax=Ditylenchus dipsaci TaxID=166011 RepID=A0A915DPM0_9BILA
MNTFSVLVFTGILAVTALTHACCSDDSAGRRSGRVSIVTNYPFSRNQSKNEENLNDIGKKFITLVKSLNTTLERIRFKQFYNNKGYLAVSLTQHQVGAKGCKQLVELTQKAVNSIDELTSAKVYCGRGKLFVIKKRSGSTTASQTENYNNTTIVPPSSSTPSSQSGSYSTPSSNSAFVASSTFMSPNSPASTSVATSLASNNTIPPTNVAFTSVPPLNNLSTITI